MSASQKSLKELVAKNRSYRKFDPKVNITEKELLKLVDTARLTPSYKNKQALKYLLISDPQDRELVFPHTRWAWYLKNWKGPQANERPAAYIVMLLDKHVNKSAYLDAGIAAQTILLAATEMNLGGCIIQTLNRYELERYFKFPENLEIVLIIALGKPTQEVVIKEIENGDSTAYYTGSDQKHYVPKRKLKDIIWKSGDKP